MSKRSLRPVTLSEIAYFRARRRRVTPQRAHELRQLWLPLDLPEDLTSELDQVVDRHTISEKQWNFTMICPHRYYEVVRHLRSHERVKRRGLAVEIWGLLPALVVTNRGDIGATQAEIAEIVHDTRPHVSECLIELVRIGAVIEERSGRTVRYRMNRNIVTHEGATVERDRHQAEDGPLLTLMDGGVRSVDEP